MKKDFKIPGHTVVAGMMLTAAIMCLPEPAMAMHIAEGIVPAPYAVGFIVAVLPFLAIGVKRMKKLKADNPLYFNLLGLFGAAVFVISAFPIPVPFAGTCSHPAGTGLSAVFLGPFPSVVVTVIALGIQALLMAHGGLTTLGANAFSMGVCGSFSAFLVYRTCRKIKLSPFWSGFGAGMAADIATYGATAAVLAVSLGNDFPTAMKEISLAFAPTQLPLSILEGAVTGFAVRYVNRHKPELIDAGAEQGVRV